MYYKTVTYQIEADREEQAVELWEIGGPEISLGYPIRAYAESDFSTSPDTLPPYRRNGHGGVS